MRLTFTEQDIANEIHKIYIEEDDLLLEGQVLEGEGRAIKLHFNSPAMDLDNAEAASYYPCSF